MSAASGLRDPGLCLCFSGIPDVTYENRLSLHAGNFPFCPGPAHTFIPHGFLVVTKGIGKG